MNRLTVSKVAAILNPLSPHAAVGIRSPRKGHNRPLLNVVFLCPPITPAAFCRVYSVMAGCIEQPLKRLAGSFAGTSNLIHSATQCFEALRGGYSPLQRNTAMNTPATHPTQRGQNQLKALFDVYHHHQLVAKNVPGSRAINFKLFNPALCVKFARMGALS